MSIGASVAHEMTVGKVKSRSMCDRAPGLIVRVASWVIGSPIVLTLTPLAIVRRFLFAAHA